MSKPIEIISSRLRLVALTEETARLQLQDRAGFFAALGVEPEPAWPPDLISEPEMRWTHDQLHKHPEDAGWYGWVYISTVMNRLLGSGGFKGAPNADGEVEIGYSMLTSYREQGLATEGVNALLDWAYGDGRVRRVIAHTRDDRDASHRVLEKAGFRQTRRFTDTDEGFDVIAWSHQRSQKAA
ncbi:GNAT family N-acetyltransferase [Maricaulis sp. CAU 1757]